MLFACFVRKKKKRNDNKAKKKKNSKSGIDFQKPMIRKPKHWEQRNTPYPHFSSNTLSNY